MVSFFFGACVLAVRYRKAGKGVFGVEEMVGEYGCEHGCSALFSFCFVFWGGRGGFAGMIHLDISQPPTQHPDISLTLCPSIHSSSPPAPTLPSPLPIPKQLPLLSNSNSNRPTRPTPLVIAMHTLERIVDVQ